MLKKAKAELGSQHTEKTKGLAQAVLDSSHQIWLAGLGAFAKAQQGGTKVFQGLVKQGESLEAKTRDVAVRADLVLVVATMSARRPHPYRGGSVGTRGSARTASTNSAGGATSTYTSTRASAWSARPASAAVPTSATISLRIVMAYSSVSVQTCAVPAG